MQYYTIEDNKHVIYAGNVDDGKNDITKYYVRKSDGSYREFENTDSNPDFRCFQALKAGTLQTFATLELAKK
jgi:6-phosphogluconolactonase (cycloisomerase 2 family)